MNTNTRMSPKDFFLHLGAMVALSASVIALINLAFEIINRLLPDTLQNYWSSSSIAWPISMLVVLVPALYVLERLISRDISKSPEKKDLGIRKWRIYLTLFLTGVTIAVDVIVLINTYLAGEISSRFIWKVLIVLVVSAVIFTYYILAKNAGEGSVNAGSVSNSRNIWLNMLAVTGIVIVLVAIVAGFIIVGSPGTQRAMRFDEQRISHLNDIQWRITSYWQKTGYLPPSLETLNDPLSNYILPVDPETGKPYEYISLNKDPHAFALCATFDLSSEGKSATSPVPTKPVSSQILGGGTLNENWLHGVGYKCFERVIDPKMYPPTINK